MGQTLNAVRSLEFLNCLWDALPDLPVAVGHETYYQLSGVPIHNVVMVREW